MCLHIHVYTYKHTYTPTLFQLKTFLQKPWAYTPKDYSSKKTKGRLGRGNESMGAERQNMTEETPQTRGQHNNDSAGVSCDTFGGS